MPKDRPPNRGGSNRPSNRGPHAPKPQPQPVSGRGTRHGGAGKGAGGGQTRPPERPCRHSMIAIPVTIVKLLFGWRPAGYQIADVPWPWQSA
jgi:hypothetical protein